MVGLVKTQSIIFDWGGVLGCNNNLYATKELCLRYPNNLDTLYEELDSLEGNFSHFSSFEDTKPYYQFFEDKYGIPGETVRRYLDEAPANSTFEFAKKLAVGGYDLFLLSNQLYSRSEAIKINNDLSIFKGVFFSSDIGVCKPDPDAYKLVLTRTGLKPDDCIFVDDRKPNLAVPLNMGMHTILYQNLDLLQEELLLFDIKC